MCVNERILRLYVHTCTYIQKWNIRQRYKKSPLELVYRMVHE
jgi:hypothetical protein